MDIETALEQYERGVSLTRIKRRFHMSDGELHDTFPDEFEDVPESENDIGGY